MKLRSLSIALVAVASLLAPALAVTNTTKPKYYCDSDDYCDTNFPGTVCITVDNYGDPISKCTPNTKARPACRGAQPGLCPSYQSEELGYLNVHCVFVAKDATSGVIDATSSEGGSSPSSSSGSGSGNTTTKKKRVRYLMLAATNATASGSGENGTAEVVVPSGSTTAAAVKDGSYVKVTIGKETVTGEFKCVDVSDCENQAYDKTTCFPSACGSPTSMTQCNLHGTCTYPSTQTMKRRACICYAGYGGEKCEKEISAACDVDCGYGGDCADGKCKCKKGYDGKAYQGKQGKPNQRCTKCTNDLACQNGNACDTETGSCACGAGYSGPTCGATEDSCVKKDCGKGNCRPATNGSAVCYCAGCFPDCQICPTKDCSTCPSPASTIALSKPLMFVSALLAMTLGNQLW